VADNTGNAVVEIIRVIQTDLASVKSNVENLMLDSRSHSTTLNILTQDVREIRGAVNDMGATRVTTGEIGALHHDVNRVQRGLADLEARVHAIEERR
jgi:hypothetical protein